jgi:hypothetical protein
VTTIKAIVVNGAIKVAHPLDLPDGTELTIPLPSHDPLGLPDDERIDTPEAIAAWLRWFDSLEPLDFSPEERAAWDTARAEAKMLELAQWDARSERIERIFP